MIGIRQNMSQNRLALGEEAKSCVRMTRFFDAAIGDFGHTAKQRGELYTWTSLLSLFDAGVEFVQRLATGKIRSRSVNSNHLIRT